MYPQELDAGNLKSKFDVLVFPDGAFRRPRAGAGAGEMRVRSGSEGGGIDTTTIPAEYRSWLGSITTAKTVPQLQQFLHEGGSVLAIGSSAALGELLGVGVTDHLTEIDHGRERALPADKFYIPGSLLRVSIDNTKPLAYGMPSQADVVFDNSPAFRLAPDAAQKQTSAVAWYDGPKVLDSGWAWGQQYLNGGAAVVDAWQGQGHVVLYGPEVLFRGQPHGTFKLFFNGVQMAGASRAQPGAHP